MGATEPRPIVIAVHGAFDRPDWACGEWRAVFGPRPFIVCPHGEPRPGGGFLWRGASQVRVNIERILDEASTTQLGPYLDRTHRVYAGFSQGGILGGLAVRGGSAPYPYVIFQEGFDDAMASPRFDDALRSAGVARLLLGCSQSGCASLRAPIRAALVRARIDARVNDAGSLGHVMDDRVFASLRMDLRWLLEGDPAWASVLDDPTLPPVENRSR